MPPDRWMIDIMGEGRNETVSVRHGRDLTYCYSGRTDCLSQYGDVEIQCRVVRISSGLPCGQQSPDLLNDVITETGGYCVRRAVQISDTPTRSDIGEQS